MFKSLTLAMFCCLVTSNTLGNDLEEIVVTADLRARSDLETLSSVTVITDAARAQFDSTHFEDLLNWVPNLNFAGGTTRARFFQIRGIGERSQYGAPLNASVGLMLDGIDFTGMGTIADLMDLEQIEVLRGPQGTRFGANGLAGLVAITSKDPTPDPSVDLSLSAGRFNLQRVSAVMNQPLSESTGLRLAIARETSDGYYQNAHLLRSDTNAIDETHVRIKLMNIGDRHELKVTLLHSDVDNGFDAFSLDNSRSTLSDEPGYDRQTSHALAMRLDLETLLGTLSLSGSVNQSDIDYGYDEDWSYIGIHPFGYQSTDAYLRTRDHHTFEARLSSNLAGVTPGSSFGWTFGVYHTDQATDLERLYTFAAGPYNSQFDNEASAIFGEIDLAFTERFLGQVGARIERRQRTFDDSNAVQFEPTETLWGGRLGLDYRIKPDLKVYLSFSRGFKAGGFNVDGTLPESLLVYDDETLIESEFGLKGQWPSTRLKFAFFHADRRDQQVKSSLVLPRADGSTEFIDFFGNAAAGVNRGVELELDHTLSQALRVSLAAGYLDTQFTRFINAFGEDLGGRDQAQAPSYTGNLTFAYRHQGWQANLSLDAKDSFYFSDRHAARSKAYTRVNFSVGRSSTHWEVLVWGRNLTDETVRTRGFGSFGNDPRKDYVTEPYYQFGPPRSFGITVSYHSND